MAKPFGKLPSPEGRKHAGQRLLRECAATALLLCTVLDLMVSAGDSEWAFSVGVSCPHLRGSASGGYENRLPKVPRRVRERRGATRKPQGPEPDPRVLTSQISQAESAAAVLEIVGKEVDGQVFNEVHMSVTCSRLAKFSQRGRLSQRDVGNQVWHRLTARLRTMLKHDALPARNFANIFWASVELQKKVKGFDEKLLAELGSYAETSSSGMNPQDVSNVLWAAAKLQDVAPEVLTAVPAIARRIPQEVDGMKPQELANSLWAAANLQDVAPEVLTAVPAIARRIPQEVDRMKPQELANSLWAAANLQDVAPEVLIAVPAIAARIPQEVDGMNGQDLSNNLWAAAKLQDVAPDVLAAVPAIAKRVPGKLQAFISLGLSTSLWACAQLKESASSVLEAVPALVAEVASRSGAMNERQLKMCLRAAAELGDDDLADQLQKQLTKS